MLNAPLFDSNQDPNSFIDFEGFYLGKRSRYNYLKGKTKVMATYCTCKTTNNSEP